MDDLWSPELEVVGAAGFRPGHCADESDSGGRAEKPLRCHPGVTPELEKWSGRLDSNQRPPAPKAGALPGCATPRLRRSYAKRSPHSRSDVCPVSPFDPDLK